STRETVKRGFDAVAMTVIRYRCSGLVTSSTSFWYGRPVGTKTTSSRSKVAWTSLAATRWPWWMGSKVPPMTPTLRLWSAISVAVRNALPRPSHNAHREEDRQGDESVPDRIHRQLGVGCMLRTLGGGHDGCVHVITPSAYRRRCWPASFSLPSQFLMNVPRFRHRHDSIPGRVPFRNGSGRCPSSPIWSSSAARGPSA